MSGTRFTRIVSLSLCTWLLSGCGSQGGSTTVVQPSASLLGPTSGDMSKSAWEPPAQGVNRYAESDSRTDTPIGGAPTTTVKDSDFTVSYTESVAFSSNGNQIQAINGESTIADAPPSQQLVNPPPLACGTDGIVYTGSEYNNSNQGDSPWQQYFPQSIVVGDSWIPPTYTTVSDMELWYVDASTGDVEIVDYPPGYSAMTTVADADATANGYTGLVELVTTYDLMPSYGISGPQITGVGLEYFSLVVTDYWLPGTGYVEEDTTETFPDYTTDPGTGIPYVSGTTTETWTIKLVGTNG